MRSVVRLGWIALSSALACAPALPAALRGAGDEGTREARVAAQVDALRADPERLRELLRGMPKGGDLHNHLSGAVYPETLLAWAAADGACIEPTTMTALAAKECASHAEAVKVPAPG
jgi:adenosine deaminase